MIRLYIAGPYNAGDVGGVLWNIHYGIRVSTEMRMLGFAPFCPWADFQEAIMRPSLGIQHWKDSSMEWLRVSQGLLAVDIIENWRDSVGTLEEMKEAKRIEIPVFFYSRLAELLRWRDRFEPRP